MLDFMKFICENKDSHEYEEPNNVRRACANFFIDSKDDGKEFHSVRIMFSAMTSVNNDFDSIFCNFWFMSKNFVLQTALSWNSINSISKLLRLSQSNCDKFRFSN